MPVSVFAETQQSLSQLKSTISTAEPAELSFATRNWLLNRPGFAEFEGLCRFLNGADVRYALREKLPVEKWAVVGGYTSRPVVSALSASLLAQGTYADVFEASYDAFDIEILNEKSQIYQFEPTNILVCTGHKNLREISNVGETDERVQQLVEKTLAYFTTRWDLVRERSGARIHQHSFDSPPVSCLGRLAHRHAWTSQRFIQEVNQRFWQRDGKQISVVDVAAVQRTVGSANWWSPKWYHHGKLGFNPECLSDYARLLQAHLAAIRGTARKCLVVDLDNTLWRGVIGDDGVEGVGFGNGTAEGEAYLEFCRYLKRLEQTGVILGVVSKNERAAAESMFRQHVEMPLELDDFAAFKANWRPKSDNLRELARDLNIGLDSIAFLDDNEAECRQVAREIPEILVLHAQGDASDQTEQLDGLRLFDRAAFTSEDVDRAKSYSSLRIVEDKRNRTADVAEFLRELEMIGEFASPTKDQTSRVGQLFAKTNQFNLTKQSFDDLEISQMRDPGRRTSFVCQLSDCHVRHGIISAIVVEQTDATVEILNWVMSCRVFNRTVEEFMLMSLVSELRKRGADTLRGTLRFTAKNKYVHDLFDRLVFERVTGNSDCRRYQLDLNRAVTLISQVTNLAQTEEPTRATRPVSEGTPPTRAAS